MKLKIGILGTRGVPNQYGGFEQFAAYLSKLLVERGHVVTVYSPHDHPYKEKSWNGVQIVHCYDPAYLLGTAGQFIYDLNCIRDARKQSFHILLILGYTSSSVWGRWYPKQSIVITNMDGMEWKRSKYNPLVQRFLRYAEKLAVVFSKYHVADSLAIKDYLDQKYPINANYISYGAVLPGKINETVLQKYGVSIGNYFLLIARMEPENNIEIILDGLCMAQVKQKVLIVGDIDNAFGKRMVAKFGINPGVCFMGAVYDAPVLDALRACCILYFHGHSVGGTNPSLLEAMACGALVCAHDNAFNRAVLGDAAFYFLSVEDVSQVALNMPGQIMIRDSMVNENLVKIRVNHSWEKIVTEYENLFIQSYQSVK
jgi:glycosyltransferase involved in cell wall biosynthesis